MTFIRCAACVNPQACAETVPEDSEKPGMCWNAYMNIRAYNDNRAKLRAQGAQQGPQPGAGAPAPAPAASPRPSAPRAPAGPANRPAAGSLTGRVWDMADHHAALGLVDKELRRTVIAACEAVGINKSTASVQFGKWLSSRN